MAPSPAATAPPRKSATRSLDSMVSGSGTQWLSSLRQDERGADEEEGRRGREAAGARHGREVDAPGLRSIDDVEARDHATDERRQDEGQQGRGQERDDDRADAALDALDEGHGCATITRHAPAGPERGTAA